MCVSISFYCVDFLSFENEEEKSDHSDDGDDHVCSRKLSN